MMQFFVQLKKDFAANFSGMSAYVVIAAYYILSLFSALYLGDYFLRESEIMNAYFSLQPIILTLIIPAITMRTWADEAKSGTLELLLTQPISYTKLVLAKFFSAYLYFGLMVATSLFLYFVSDYLSVLDFGLTISGYCGLLLSGAFFTAVGCFISAMNRNNVLSYITTIFALFFITQLGLTSIGSISLDALNFEYNYKAFLTGVFGAGNVLYFLAGIFLFLWLNVVALEYRKAVHTRERRSFYAFAFLLLLIFAESCLSASFWERQTFDVTDDGKFTLPEEDVNFLKNTSKRIDIILYESAGKRQEANSRYAVYAEFVERILQLIEKTSQGAIRVQTILVEPFSQLERQLIYDDEIWFEEDKFGQKIFMAATFSDNEGHRKQINYFSNLRQNLLETDIMRLIRQFGKPLPKAVVFAPTQDWKEMLSFQGLLEEFYQLKYLGEKPLFIPTEYNVAIVINPDSFSSENLLAMEQYVLSGGSLIVFADPKNPSLVKDAPVSAFLKNFGIIAHSDTLTREEPEIALAIQPDTNKNIRSILVSDTGTITTKDSTQHKTYPLLQLEGKNDVIAVVSTGKYTSNYLNFAASTTGVHPVSAKEGKVFFIFDSDLLKDYLYTSAESAGHDFYQTIPFADNMLFFLRLMDYATGNDVEKFLTYRHYALNTSSIGNAILANIRNSYAQQSDELDKQKASLLQKKENFYSLLASQGYASVKNIGDISKIEQSIDETESHLYQIQSNIASTYQTSIMIITLVLIFAVPAVLLILLFAGMLIGKKRKQQKIRRLLDATTTL